MGDRDTTKRRRMTLAQAERELGQANADVQAAQASIAANHSSPERARWLCKAREREAACRVALSTAGYDVLADGTVVARAPVAPLGRL